MINLPKHLKFRLWKTFGVEEFPAEWDGNNLGGGKLSQRFWEYFKAIELLDLNGEAKVLDIGGGSPCTGMGFFASLIHETVKQVVVVDPNIHNIVGQPSNVILIKKNASAKELREIFLNNPAITHIVSISVLEHIEPSLRQELIKTVNDYSQCKIFVATFEYHPRISYWEHQLTARTLSELFESFTNYYPTMFESSPVWCEDAFSNIPKWYPIAIKFERMA